jgi:hypothetical protein
MPDLRLDDDRLATVLASVGENLVVDRGVDAAPLGRGHRPLWRPLLVAAAVLAVIAATVLAVAPARRVVSGWFGAGRIEVEVDRSADPTGLPSFTAPAERIDSADAGEFLGRPMPLVDGSSLGVPRDWWTLPEGGVLVSWPDGGTSLWVVVTNRDGDVVKKVAEGNEVVAELPALGDGGLAVTGGHLLQTPHRRVRADAVVAWSDGELTFRLEGTRPIDELIAIAEQLAD